jgi:ELP3 family radical SAM enzyme/protein acetyltransferase
MKLLRDNCFKVDIHIMPNLPGTTVEKDKTMMDVVLNSLHPDQVKVYPCETTPFTKILEDYKAGTYVPYDNDALTDVVLYWKTRVHPWIRNNRIVRDIPDSYIIDGVKSSSQRCEFQHIMKARGLVCRCIRCREAGRFPNADPANGDLMIRSYNAQDGDEHFISWESKDETILYGFLRLRLISQTVENEVFPELNNVALIRELHVYGRTVAAGISSEDAVTGETTVAQHLGIGRRLLEEAERVAFEAGYKRIAVISGIGVQNYYERNGYSLTEGNGEFMMKPLIQKPDSHSFSLLIGFTLLYMSILLVSGLLQMKYPSMNVFTNIHYMA